MVTQITLPLATDVALRHRILRYVYVRSARFWACIGIGIFAFVVLVFLQEERLIGYSHPFVFLVLYFALLVALITPYDLLFRALTEAGKPICEVRAHLDSRQLSLTGTELSCTFLTGRLRSAWLMKDVLLLNTRYPIDGLLLCRPASLAQETALLRILEESGVACRGDWASRRRPPPPLSATHTQDPYKE